MMFGISKVDSSFKAWSPVALVGEMQFVTLEFLGSVVEPCSSRNKTLVISETEDRTFDFLKQTEGYLNASLTIFC